MLLHAYEAPLLEQRDRAVIAAKVLTAGHPELPPILELHVGSGIATLAPVQVEDLTVIVVSDTPVLLPGWLATFRSLTIENRGLGTVRLVAEQIQGTRLTLSRVEAIGTIHAIELTLVDCRAALHGAVDRLRCRQTPEVQNLLPQFRQLELEFDAPGALPDVWRNGECYKLRNVVGDLGELPRCRRLEARCAAPGHVAVRGPLRCLELENVVLSVPSCALDSLVLVDSAIEHLGDPIALTLVRSPVSLHGLTRLRHLAVTDVALPEGFGEVEPRLARLKLCVPITIDPAIYARARDVLDLEGCLSSVLDGVPSIPPCGARELTPPEPAREYAIEQKDLLERASSWRILVRHSVDAAARELLASLLG